MRIHSNTLTRQDFTDAAKHAGVEVVNLSEHGSQSRARAFKFSLSGSGTYGGQFGAQDYKTATWDEWGIFFARLYDVDPEMTAGSKRYGYQSAEHYHWVTGDRFRTLTPQQQHLRHNWLSGDSNGRSMGGAYYVHSCKCGALQRQMAPGYEFTEWVLQS